MTDQATATPGIRPSKLESDETASLSTNATNATLVGKEADSDSIATSRTDVTIVPENHAQQSSLPESQSPPSHPAQSDKSSWLDKLRRSKPEEPGREKWRDANLSEKERWKEWQKAKDKEQKKNSTAGFYTEQYKGKGKKGYWLDAFF